MLLEASRSSLLVVDVQTRLLPAMTDPELVVRNGTILLAAASQLQVPALVSEQYPQGLGPTVPDLIVAGVPILPKMTFSCAADQAIAAAVRASGREQLVIAGIEAHVCVLQTALDFRAAGRQVYVVADAVSSRRPESKAVALDRLRQAGVAVVTTEMVVFEWLHRAGSDAFRALSKLIK